MKHGELFWVNLPDRKGHEQRGRRPALIWQDTVAFPPVPMVLIIPFTSRMDTLRFGGSVLVQPSIANGLSSSSVALVFQLGACDVRRIEQRLGQLDENDLAKIREVAIKLQKLG